MILEFINKNEDKTKKKKIKPNNVFMKIKCKKLNFFYKEMGCM